MVKVRAKPPPTPPPPPLTQDQPEGTESLALAHSLAQEGRAGGALSTKNNATSINPVANCTAAASSSSGSFSSIASPGLTVVAPPSPPPLQQQQQQRGRKRAASFDAGDPTNDGNCGEGVIAPPPGKIRASEISGGGSGSAAIAAAAEKIPTSTTTTMDVDDGSNNSTPLSKEKVAGSSKSSRGGNSLGLPVTGVSVPVLQGFPGTGGQRLRRRKSPLEIEDPPDEELRSSGVVREAARLGGEGEVGVRVRPGPPELPLLELEKQSTVDTLFELMESGQSVSVLVWDLLMKMPTNMRLYNGFS